jgi:hypothetical protein
LRSNAHAGVYRETAEFVAQHLFGVKTLEQTAPNKGAQDAAAQGGLHLGHGFRIHPAGGVEDHTRPAGLSVSISSALAHRVRKHAIDCADVEVNMLVQAGAQGVDEGDCDYVQSGLDKSSKLSTAAL